MPTLPCFIYRWPRPGLSKLLLKSLCGAVWLGILGALLLWDRRPAFAEALVLKQGELRALPLLQTRARLPLQPLEMLYLGMFEERFLNYARANNWETISSNREDPRWTRWQLRPGGEALYLADPFLLQDPLQPPIYARGFYVQAYFVAGRLVGMHLIQNPEEPGFNLKELQKLIRAWFPDNRLMLHYQVLPEDPHQQVLGAYLGNIPSAFIADIQLNRVPFCQTFLTPTSPQPITPPLIDPPPHCLRMTDAAHVQAEVNGATALGEGSPLVR
ncbi:hypothetical protein L1047_08560 [Synechococcus sp. Nb3U1]|uniref:hypothetical protein n=1 Tax=Synechococcus sp. Nb3U1 TaxID=1914529 RepID=UPI001F38DDA7|nr:hypothetical protein [Synechococcus sp. Nb3U1]MCF2971244.1 hypothetical protein [Synechococcus sp. Nb3U1]